MSRRITERYRLDKLVRASAAASVFRATDLRSDATVAVKLMTETTGADQAEQRARFLAASRALQEITHPAVPRVLDYGFTSGGNAFLVTDFAYGTTLEVFAGSPAPRIVALLLLVTEGLEALDAAGVAHGNLRVENLLVTPGAQGEQVQLLGLGTAALRPVDAPAGAEGRRVDLQAFARVACALLGIRVPAGAAAARVTLPPTVAGTLHEPEALSALLSRLLREDLPGPPPRYEEVRAALRAALFGAAGARVVASRQAAGHDPDRTAAVAVPELEATAAAAATDETAAMTAPAAAPVLPVAASPVEPAPEAAAPGFEDLTTRVFHPPEPPGSPGPPAPPAEPPTLLAEALPTPPPAPAPLAPPPAVAAAGTAPALTTPTTVAAPTVPAPARRSAGSAARRRRPAWVAAAAFVGPATLLVLLVAAVALRWGGGRAHGEQEAGRGATISAPPRSSGPSPGGRLDAPPRTHPLIERAEAHVVAGQGDTAWEVLQSIPAAERQRFTDAERDRYESLAAALGEARSERSARQLARALRGGDLKEIRGAAAALEAAGGEEVAAAVHRDLSRARRALDVASRLEEARGAGDREAAMARSAELVEVLPGAPGAVAAREEAAVALEAAADAAAAEGRHAEARALLAAVERAWPDRPGLPERRERLAAAGRTDERLEAALAAAAGAERDGRPHEGLRALAEAVPTARFAGRFEEAHGRLRAQLERLDSAAPKVAARRAAPGDYEKDAPIALALEITDDYEVASAELWCRPEGGRFTALPLSRRSPTGYDAEIPAALHQNKTVEWYVVATDHSGHEGRLGGPDEPNRIRRKRWWTS